MGRLDEINAAVEAVSSEQNDARQGSLLGATEQNPDEVGEAARLGRKLSLPTAVVVDNLPELRRKRKLEEINAAITDAPVLSRELQKPEFAGVAHDDVEGLRSTEWAASFKPTINGTDVSMLIEESMKRNPALDWDTARSNVLRKYNVDADATGLLKTPQQPTLTPESFITGLFTSTKNLIPKMREQARMQFAGTLGLPEMEARALRRYEQYESRDSLATPSFEATTYPSDPYTPVQERSELARYGYGGAQSVITNIPGLTLAILTKNPYVALAPAVTQTELDQYARTRARGGSVLESTTAGVLSGVVEGVTELYPMKFLVDSFGRKTIMQIVTGDQIREQLGEQVATWFQDAIDTAIANPNKTWAEYFKERPDAMAQTAVAVLMQSAVVATAGVVANSTAGKNDASIKADQYAQTLLKLTQLAEASKIRARDPESFQQFVAAVTEDGPVQDVWVSPNTLMQAGVDVQALAAVSPSFSAQLDEAIQTNGEVRIPVAEFATTLPGTGFEQTILPHLRTDPDMPTQAEAQVFMQTQAEEFQREAEQVLAQQENAAAFNASAQVVEDSILSQLKTANRFTNDVNQEYATLARSVFTSAAARLGVTPEEAYQKFALQVRAQQIAAQYDQVTGQLRTETPEFKAWFGDSKVVDAAGKPLVVYHGTTALEDFSEFEGGWFVSSGEHASQYAGPKEGGRVYPVYLNIQNPVDPNVASREAELAGVSDADYTAWVREKYDGFILRKKGMEGVIYVPFSPTQIKSVFNRGTFDPNDPNILNQSTRDFSMTEEEEAVSLIDWVYGDRPRFTTANSLREFGELLVEMSPKAHGEHTDENRDFIAGVMVKEVEAALRSGNHAAGWYKQNLETALQIAAIEHPEILESEIEKFTFNYILAVTSNGLDIGKNYALASTLYADYRKKGRLSTDTEGLLKPGGARVHDMAKAFQLFNNVKNHEGLELFKEFMLTKHDVGLMKKINPGIRELVEQELYGGTVIGSKIGGGFLQNLNGNHDALTMDRWFLRMWGRVSGTLLDDSSESGLLDDPKNGGNRAFMRETAELALAQVRARGHDIEMSDLQALLWYPEKELYAMHGVADAHVEGTDYASEAAKHAAARGYGEHPVVAEALRNASAPVGRAGRRASDTGRGGLPAGTGAYAQGPTVTQGAQALVDQHTPELIEEYFSRFGNVIDPDNVKQLFPAYVADPSLAAAVHEPSSQLAKAIFTEALRRNAGAPVVFTAGGGGSGKTEAMSVAQALLGGPQEGGLIYDSTLSSFESAVRRIDEALATGSEVDIVYTNREVGDAFEFAMQRARVVPVPVLARAHVGAAETIRQLAEHYADNPNVQISVVNNLGEIDDINLGSLADVPAYEYNEVERRLYELARRAKETNRISESRYAALTAPAGGTPEVSAGGLQEGEQGQDLGGIDEGLARLFQSSSQQPTSSSAKITSLDEFDSNMPAFLRKDGWIVITATTSGDPYSEANVAANQALEEDLKTRGLPYRSGEGFYLKDPQGTSFLVQGDEALGIELAKKYNQESVLTKDGYVYQDGSLTTVDHTKDTFGEEAKKQDGYTTIGDKTFSLGLEFAYRVAKEHRPKLGLEGAVHGVRAVHYSTGKRTLLSSSMYGRGAKGAEFERVANDEVLSHRIHFYVSNGQGVFPEGNVGNEAHLAILNNLYDMSADPLNVRFKPASEMEHALVAAGYSGMLVRDVFTRQGAVVLLGRQNVPVEATDDPNGWAEVPPPPKETTGTKRALLDFASDKRLPAGQLAPAAWEAYVLRITPERHEALKGTGIFDAADQSPKYRDEMVKAVFEQPALGRSRAQREASEQAFYSALAEAVADIRKVAGKDGTIAPAQAKAWLTARQKEGRFKAAELEAVGLAEWLDLQQGKISVDDIETFVREHGVQVEETMLGAPDGWTVTDSERLDWLETNRDDLSDAEETERQGLIRRENAATPDGLSQPVMPKFSDYQLPGGENYRELLLRLPRIAEKQYRFQVFGAFPMDFATREAAEQYIAHIQAQPELRADLAKYPPSIEPVETDASRAKEFRSSHFDQPNILAHVRFNERTDADGKRVLFLEELQSDWAQKGRKEGFDIEPTVSRLENGKWQIQRGVERTELPPGRFKSVEEAQAWATENYRGRGEIPSAPFVTDTKAWVALALKRMIRYAAENGFDRVAWTTGEQQAARYDLSKHLTAIEYEHNGSGRYHIAARGLDGRIALNDTYHETELEGVVGKDVAEKIIRGEGSTAEARQSGHTALSGLDLKVGGEGMKAFYDKIVPQVANEVLKKFGGEKVGEVDIPAAREELNNPAYASRQPGFDITPALKGEAMAGLPLFSQQGTTPRGQIAFGPDITQQASTITLLQQADLSTFIHELGHFQLEVLASMATTDASAAGDMQTILSWFGVRDLAAWNTMTLEEKRPYHEQFARGFESYLFEGKAPAVELQGAFARVRAWMLNVYKNLTALNVTLTDEVRGVFDRMLATEQQIADAESARGFGALFSSAEAAGMTAEEWTQYQSLQAAATEEAKAELQSRSLRNMQWLTNAKGRELKRLQKDAAAKRKSVEAEVREEVRAQPVYGARRFLAYGEVGPEVLFSEGEALSGKLDLGALKEMYGEGPAALWRYLPTGENGLAGLEGLHPDQVAEMFGFTSGDHLVRELLAAHPEAEVIEGMTDQRMLERYGDLSDPVSVERAAEKAIHNEVRAKVISTELAALARATGQRRPLVTAAREFAERVVARTLVRRLKPAQYSAAEGRAAKGAMSALAGGNLVEAAVEKRNQLVNNLTAKAAVEAAGEIEQGVIYLKKFLKEGTRGKIDIDYLDQIDAILERFDLRTGQSLRAIDKRKSLADWIAAQEDMGLDPAIPDNIRDAAFRKHYKDLTVEEFRGLIDGVRNIEHLGRLKTKLLTAVRQREFAAAVEEIVTSIEENATGTVEERRTSDRGRLADIGTVFRGFLADHRKFASLMREMDGWKDGGTAWEYFVRGMNRAGDFEATEREKATIKLSELLKPILKAGALGKKTYFPQIGKSFTREERIGIALNVGNETNRERLLTGEKLSPVQLQSILDTLTQEEWQFVDSIWKYFETFRPQIAEKERRLTGVEPEWVKPTPVMTKFGELTGGYYPIAYDTLRSTRAEADTAAEVQRQLERGLYVRAQTRRGHTKARVESTGRPMRYDLGVIVKHVDQVVHDLAWHEFLIDANRLLRNGKVDAAIREHYGVEKLRALKDTLRDIAIGDMAAQTSGERILNHLRHGATIVGLGWRITTSLLQPIGLTQSIVRVGPQWIAKGVRHWAGDTVRLENSARVIGEKSDFMRLRAKTLQREINEIRNKVAGRDSVMEASYFYLIQKLQLVADIPTWWGAYEKAMASEDNEARAIALADQAVIDAQGSGQIKDLSQIQRGSAGWKLFTNFYSFFNTTYNLTRESLGRTSFRSPGSVALLGIDLLLLYTIPAILGTLMKAALSGDWDDEEELLRKLLADQVNYLTGTMVLVREAGGVAQNMIDPQHSFDYTGPASLRFFSEASKLAKQIGQGEADEPFWKALNNVSGTIFHYPAGQINATVDGIASIADGKTQNPGALAVGHSDR